VKREDGHEGIGFVSYTNVVCVRRCYWYTVLGGDAKDAHQI